MSEAPTQSNRIPGLDGLRAISIAFVFAGHLAGTRFCFSGKTLAVFGDLANLGVRVFFIISGYLITTLLLKEYQRSGSISLRNFYARRTLRIFPAFYCFLLVMTIAWMMGLIVLRPGDLLHSFTYTVNYHHDRSWWLGHIWSLSVEEQFYLLWPAVLLLFGVRRGLRVALVAVVMAPAIRIATFYLLPGHRAGIGESFPTVADTIAAGCLLAGYGSKLRASRWFGRLLGSKWFVAVPILTIVLNRFHGGRIRLALVESMINFCVALCIARCTQTADGPVMRVLNSRPFVFIGVLSYSLYLWQQPFLNREFRSPLTMFPYNIVLTCCAALACHYLVERPFLSLRERVQSASLPDPPARDYAAVTIGELP